MSSRLPPELLVAMALPSQHVVTNLAGNANDNYLLESAGRKMVIKCLGEQSSDNAELEGAYRQYLHENGLPVTRFLKFLSGHYVQTVGTKSYVAMEYIEGEEARGLQQVVAPSLGSLSARLHRLDYGSLPQREHWLNGRYIDHLAEHQLLPNSQLQEAYMQIRLFPDFWGMNLPVGIGHGDLHLGNIIVDAHKRIVSLIDWEEVGVMPLILDVAGTAQALSQSRAGFDAGVFRQFFADYQRVRPLTAAEKELLSEAIRYRSFIVYVWAGTKHQAGRMTQDRVDYFKQRYYSHAGVPQLP